MAGDVLGVKPLGFETIGGGDLASDFEISQAKVLRSFADLEVDGTREITIKISYTEKSGGIAVDYAVAEKIPSKKRKGSSLAVSMGGGKYGVFEAQQAALPFSPIREVKGSE